MSTTTEKVVFNGKIFTRYLNSSRSKSRYFYGEIYSRETKRGKKIALHRYVWEHYNGPIPWDCVIHHKDDNPANNAIENLECISSILHLRNCHSSRSPRVLPENFVEVHTSKSDDRGFARSSVFP